MAVAHSQQVRWVKCEHCDDRGKAHEYVQKRFCSWECKLLNRGEDVLDTLKYDHTTCFSCWSELKTVYRPEGHGRGLANKRAYKLGVYSTPPEGFRGWQTRTPNATEGIDAYEPGEHLSKPFHRGTSCGACGNVNPKHRIAFLDQFAEGDPHERLFEALCRLESRGAIDDRPNWQTLRDELAEGEPLAYAIGKSIET